MLNHHTQSLAEQVNYMKAYEHLHVCQWHKWHFGLWCNSCTLIPGYPRLSKFEYECGCNRICLHICWSVSAGTWDLIVSTAIVWYQKLPVEQECLLECVCVCVCVCIMAMKHRGSFINARMRDWHCLAGVRLYVHVCLRTEVESGRSAQPGTRLLKPYLCARERELDFEWARQRPRARQRDGVTKTEGGLCLPQSVSLHKVSRVATADFKSLKRSKSSLKSFPTCWALNGLLTK